MQPRRFELDNTQKAKNRSLIDQYVSNANAALKNAALKKGTTPSAESIGQVSELLVGFTEEHAIDLSQLVTTRQKQTSHGFIISGKEEKFELQKIIVRALQKQNAHNDADILSKLKVWRDNLVHARAGYGDHVAMHAARSTGIVDDLLRYGRVPPNKLATDLDIIQFIGNDLTHPSTINSAGAYILPPVSLTESKERIKTLLKDASDAIQGNKINNKVLLLVPVNNGDQHWVLAKCEFENQVLTSAYLRDSMLGDEAAFKETLGFKNFSSAINEVKAQNESALKKPVSKAIDPSIAFFGAQKNSTSCGPHTVKAAYQIRNIDNEIVQANNDNEVELAFVRKIAFNHPALGPGVANNLVRNADGSIGLKNNVAKISLESSPDGPDDAQTVALLLNKFTTKDAQISEQEKTWVVLFDEVFASILQDLENARKTIDDRELDAARQKAARFIGFFPAADKRTETNENNTPGHENNNTLRV